MTLDRTFYSILLVTGRIRDIGQNVLQFSFGNWENLESSFGNWAST